MFFLLIFLKTKRPGLNLQKTMKKPKNQPSPKPIAVVGFDCRKNLIFPNFRFFVLFFDEFRFAV